MITFDLDKLLKKFDNKFYLVLGIVNRVEALKRGVQPIVERRGSDLISVGIEELEADELSWEVHDEYVPPFRLEGYDIDEAGLADEEADVEEIDAAFAEMPIAGDLTTGDGGDDADAGKAQEAAQQTPSK